MEILKRSARTDINEIDDRDLTPKYQPTNVSGGHVGEQMETTREKSDENEEVSEVRPT